MAKLCMCTILLCVVFASGGCEKSRAFAGGNRVECSCGIVGFENNESATGTCTATGISATKVKVRSTSGTPSFVASLRKLPKPKPSKTTYYALKGDIDIRCKESWCGKNPVSVLWVERLNGYRATVARSPEGPPSHVLHLQCGKHGRLH